MTRNPAYRDDIQSVGRIVSGHGGEVASNPRCTLPIASLLALDKIVVAEINKIDIHGQGPVMHMTCLDSKSGNVGIHRI